MVGSAEEIGGGITGAGITDSLAPLLGFTALFTLASWWFADPAGGECSVDACAPRSPESAGSETVAPTCTFASPECSGGVNYDPEGNPANLDYSPDDDSALGPCGVYACPPPPPPPPPQDIYAEGAKIQKAPKALLDDPIITSVVKDITTASKLLSGADSITETVKPVKTTVQGTAPSSNNTSTSNVGDVDENTIFQKIIKDIGVPDEPEPETQLQLAAAGSGNGGRGSTTAVAMTPGDSGGSGNGGPSFGSRLASLAKNAAMKVWPGWKQVGIGAVSGAASNYLSGVEQKQTGSQLWEDVGLGAVTGAASNLGSGLSGGLFFGAASGAANGAGSQMISNQSWDLSKVNGRWAAVDAGLGSLESLTGWALVKDLPVGGDASPGNYSSGGAGFFASGVCGWLDNSEIQAIDYRPLKRAAC